MSYKIYTSPNCGMCEIVKKILKGKNLEYQEVNIGIGEGRKDFSEFYKQNKSSLGTSLPILVYDSKIFQGLEKITELIKNGN